MNRWRAVALELCAGVVFALIVVPIVAQSKPEPVDTGSGLKLRLVIPDPNVCVDSKLVAFEIVLMNEGEQPIAVYKSSLSEFVFTRDKREQGKTTTQTFEDDKDTAAEASAAAKDPSITIMPRSYIVIPFKYDVAAAFSLRRRRLLAESRLSRHCDEDGRECLQRTREVERGIVSPDRVRVKLANTSGP